jgi:hypothetical protein
MNAATKRSLVLLTLKHNLQWFVYDPSDVPDDFDSRFESNTRGGKIASFDHYQNLDNMEIQGPIEIIKPVGMDMCFRCDSLRVVSKRKVIHTNPNRRLAKAKRSGNYGKLLTFYEPIYAHSFAEMKDCLLIEAKNSIE